MSAGTLYMYASEWPAIYDNTQSATALEQASAGGKDHQVLAVRSRREHRLGVNGIAVARNLRDLVHFGLV